MSIAISNGSSVPQVYTPQASSKNETSASTAASKSTDTVRLTQTQQIHALKHEGQSASQIAKSMGVSLASVDSVLGITESKTSTAAAGTSSASTSSTTSSTTDTTASTTADTTKAAAVDTTANTTSNTVVDTKASGTPAPALVDVQA